MKLICLVVLGLLMACVGQAEEIYLTAGNYTVKFDPGVLSGTARFVDFNGTSLDGTDYIGRGAFFCNNQVSIYINNKNISSVTSDETAEDLKTIMGMNGYNDAVVFPRIIAGYPGAVAVFSPERGIASCFSRIIINRSMFLNLKIQDVVIYQRIIKSMKIEKN